MATRDPARISMDVVEQLAREHGFGACQTFDDVVRFGRAVRAAEQNRCAELLQQSSASLMLMAGELTAQELRTVKAVLGGMRALIQRA